MSTAQKKEQLLEIAKSGQPKPKQGCHKLGMNLVTYTWKNGPCYDPVFTKTLQTLRPDWFKRTRKKPIITS